MKISASVPDELWTAAAGDETSTSRVVQHALEALLERRRASEDRIRAVEARFRTRYPQGEADEDVLAPLEAQARRLQSSGYMLGVDLAVRIGWPAVEELPAGLATLLRSWAEDRLVSGLDDVMGNYDGFEDALVDLMHDYGDGLDPAGEPIISTVFYDAIAAGVDDTRAAVRDRVRDPIEES